MELSEDQNYVENVRNLLQNVNDAFPGNQNRLKMTQIQPKMPNSNPKIHKNPKNGHKMFLEVLVEHQKILLLIRQRK